MDELAQIKRDLEELKTWKRNMERSFSIPRNIENALRTRLNQFIFASKSINFGEVLDNGNETQSVTVAGAQDGDVVVLGIPNIAENAGVFYTAWVSSVDTVTIRFNNESGLTLNKGEGVFKIVVIKNV